MDLYEFAPVGYITINRKGLIKEINLKGAAFLGVDRAKLINQRFSKFIAEQDQDRWYRLFLNIMDHPKGKQANSWLRDNACRWNAILWSS